MRSIVQSTLQKCKKGQQAQQLIGPKLQSDINASTNFWIAIGKPLPIVHMMRTWSLSPILKVGHSNSHLGMYNFGHSFTNSLDTTASFIDVVAFTKAGIQHFAAQKLCPVALHTSIALSFFYSTWDDLVRKG